MEIDNSFIDIIIKKSFALKPEKPKTTWEDMLKIMNERGVLSKQHSTFPVFNNFKTDITVFSGILILAAGIYYFSDKPETLEKPVKFEKNTMEVRDTSVKNVLQSDKNRITKDTAVYKKSNIKKTNKNEQVKIKVTVPVHKEVIVKKQIILKDTIN
jgi:hypothetical protein